MGPTGSYSESDPGCHLTDFLLDSLVRSSMFFIKLANFLSIICWTSVLEPRLLASRPIFTKNYYYFLFIFRRKSRWRFNSVINCGVCRKLVVWLDERCFLPWRLRPIRPVLNIQLSVDSPVSSNVLQNRMKNTAVTSLEIHNFASNFTSN